MPSILANYRDFHAFRPALDPRTENGIVVVDGENFLFDVDGPKSAFATRLGNWDRFAADNRANWQEFLVEDEFFYGTPTGLMRINPVSKYPEMVLSIPITAQSRQYWPWSYAKIGNIYYFAQFDIGLWQYNQETAMWTLVTLYFQSVRFICESYGRLLVLSDTAVYWSSLDDGTDFAPSLTTGAGFQSLSLLSRNAFRIDAVVDGVIISTDRGWLKGQFVSASYVFRWYVISHAVESFTPNSVVNIRDLGLIGMDAHGGFFLTTDGKPQAWEPEMGAYLKERFFKKLNKKLFGLIQLKYSHGSKLLFVSFAPNNREGFYQNTFVYSLLSGKWGRFSRPHRGIFELTSATITDNLPAYMKPDGYIHVLDGDVNCETLPAVPTVLADVAYRRISDPLLLSISGVYTGSSYIEFADIELELFPPVLMSGLYAITERTFFEDDVDTEEAEFVVGTPYIGISTFIFDDVGGVQFFLRAYQLPQISMNSSLDIGPIRFAGQKTALETSTITEIAIGLHQTSEDTIEDWNTAEGEEDWNTDTGEADWGFKTRADDNFDLVNVQMDDGISHQLQGEEFVPVRSNLGSVLTYAPEGWSGVYHKLRLRAFETDQGFSLKTLDLTGLLTGVQQ